MKYLLFLFLTACSVKTEKPVVDSGNITVETLPITKEEDWLAANQLAKALRGKEVYRQRCMACHVNPKTGGSFCPPNYGSSLELLRLKVLEGKYPNGYKPKKNTKVMPRFPYLDKDIENLFEYLNTLEKL